MMGATDQESIQSQCGHTHWDGSDGEAGKNISESDGVNPIQTNIISRSSGVFLLNTSLSFLLQRGKRAGEKANKTRASHYVMQQEIFVSPPVVSAFPANCRLHSSCSFSMFPLLLPLSLFILASYFISYFIFISPLFSSCFTFPPSADSFLPLHPGTSCCMI